jgi:hypothetical protein
MTCNDIFSAEPGRDCSIYLIESFNLPLFSAVYNFDLFVTSAVERILHLL